MDWFTLRLLRSSEARLGEGEGVGLACEEERAERWDELEELSSIRYDGE